MATFDTTAYLNNKVAQLNKTGQDGRNNWTVADARKAISDAGLSLKDHYEQYGKSEGVSASGSSPRPQMVSPVFDADAYLANKAEQLNLTGQGGRNNWTADDARKAIADSGMDLQSHYQRYGAAEGVLPYAEAQPMAVGASAPQSTVSPNQTSQHQLQQMLASDSPLMQQAETMGLQRANSRGLLNSSMASQAAQGAMIERATPFAQQDASTYFQADQNNADRRMQDYMSDKQYQQQLGLNQQGYGFDMNRLQASSTANAWGVMSNNITDIVAQSMDAINNIQANPNIDTTNKSAMIEQILQMRDTDIQFQSGLYDSLSGYLRDTGLFPNL